MLDGERAGHKRMRRRRVLRSAVRRPDEANEKLAHGLLYMPGMRRSAVRMCGPWGAFSQTNVFWRIDMLMLSRDLVSVARLTSGRRIMALLEMRPISEELGNTPLTARIDEALAHDRYTRYLDSMWSHHGRNNLYNPRVPEIDSRADITITGTRDMALAQSRGRPAGDARAALATRFLKEAFPKGAAAITALPYVDQVAAMEELMERLRGPLAPVVAELGLSAQVDYLGEITVEYRTAVREAGQAVTFDKVREAREHGQELFTAVIALVITTYYNPKDSAHVAARDRLLAPVMAQDKAIRAYLSRRAAVRDVDPETGEVEGEASDVEETSETEETGESGQGDDSGVEAGESDTADEAEPADDDTAENDSVSE